MAISCDVPKRRLYDISVNVQIDYLSGHGRGHSARKENSIMASIENKGTALITGASSGIGAVYADRLARQGYDLILVARNRDRLQELANRLTTETGRSVEIVTADLGSPADLARVEAALRTDASVTMLVNNAGVGATAPLLGSDIARMDEMIALNVGALTRLTYAAAPGFVARGGGTIVNIASIVAISPETLNGVYGGSKAFVLAFSQSLHHELADKGVRIQAVLPGATATEFWGIAGLPVHNLPTAIVMSAEDMVDAALAGLEQGETVTIPALPDKAEWDAFDAARRAMSGRLSSAVPAARYNVGPSQSTGA
jgi:short-subunit dehydrogenase